MTAESLARSLIGRARERLDFLALAREKRAWAWYMVVREAQECVELALKGLLRAVALDPPQRLLINWSGARVEAEGANGKERARHIPARGWNEGAKPPDAPSASRPTGSVVFGLGRRCSLGRDDRRIDPALAPWPAPKTTATRPTPIFQQSPKLHDIGPFLLRHRPRIERGNPELEIERLMKISQWLPEEREKAFYGEIDFIPQDHYTQDQAERAISDATFTVEQAEAVLAASR